jgi:hypothetical protein
MEAVNGRHSQDSPFNRTNSMEHTHSSEADILSSSQILCLYRTQMFITVSTRARHWILSEAISFRIGGGNWWINAANHVTFSMKLSNKWTYKFCIKRFHIYQQLQTWKRCETQMLYQVVEGVDAENVHRETQHKDWNTWRHGLLPGLMITF